MGWGDLEVATLQTVWDFLSGRPLVFTLLTMNAVDFASGFLVAFNGKDVSSSASFWGLSKKLMMWMMVAVAYALQRHVSELPLGDLAAVMYIGVEGLSLIEHAAYLGLPVPDALVDSLRNMRTQSTKNRRQATVQVDAEFVEMTSKRVDQHSDSVSLDTNEVRSMVRGPTEVRASEVKVVKEPGEV